MWAAALELARRDATPGRPVIPPPPRMTMTHMAAPRHAGAGRRGHRDSHKPCPAKPRRPPTLPHADAPCPPPSPSVSHAHRPRMHTHALPSQYTHKTTLALRQGRPGGLVRGCRAAGTQRAGGPAQGAGHGQQAGARATGGWDRGAQRAGGRGRGLGQALLCLVRGQPWARSGETVHEGRCKGPCGVVRTPKRAGAHCWQGGRVRSDSPAWTAHQLQVPASAVGASKPPHPQAHMTPPPPPRAPRNRPPCRCHAY